MDIYFTADEAATVGLAEAFFELTRQATRL